MKNIDAVKELGLKVDRIGEQEFANGGEVKVVKKSKTKKGTDVVLYKYPDGHYTVRYGMSEIGQGKSFENADKSFKEYMSYYAKGGEISEKRQRVAEYILDNEDLTNYNHDITYEELDNMDNSEKLIWIKENILADKDDVNYYFDKYLYDDKYAKSGILGKSNYFSGELSFLNW